jgi:pimeloyl-ACP methyl ester carboxylesterase
MGRRSTKRGSLSNQRRPSRTFQAADCVNRSIVTSFPAIARRPRRAPIILKMQNAHITAIFAAALMISGCVIPTHPVESARLLREVAAGEDASAVPASEPRAEPVAYTADCRHHTADLYLPPGQTPEAGVVLVPGLAREGNREPRLIVFARSLARARFAVLVPDIQNLRLLKVQADDARQIGDAFRYLVSRSNLAPGGRAGIVATSYAVGPAVLAALEPDIASRVRFVLGVGSYYSLEEVITFAITGYYRDRTEKAPQWHHMEQYDFSKWIFLLSNLDYISNPRDRELLRQIADRKLRDSMVSTDTLAQRLGGQGRAFYKLLTTSRPELVPEQLARLPFAVQQKIAALDLARRDLSQLRAKIILIHGRNDPLIPYTESKALAAAAPKSRLFLVNNLAHVDLEKGGLLDLMRLMRAIDEVLAQR